MLISINSLPVCSADFPIWLSSFQHCLKEELSPSDSSGGVSKGSVYKNFKIILSNRQKQVHSRSGSPTSVCIQTTWRAHLTAEPWATPGAILCAKDLLISQSLQVGSGHSDPLHVLTDLWKNASKWNWNVISETPYLEDVWSTSSSGWLRLVRSRLYFVL